MSAASHAQCRTPYFRHPPYAATAAAAEWPHRTHDYVLSSGTAIKVYSVSTKAGPTVESDNDLDDGVVSLLSEDNDSEDSLPRRERRPPARDKVDPAIASHFAGVASRKEKKRKSGGEKTKSKRPKAKSKSNSGAARAAGAAGAAFGSAGNSGAAGAAGGAAGASSYSSMRF